LHKLNFEKFVEAKKVIKENNNKIEEHNLKNKTDIEIIDLLLDIYNQNMEKIDTIDHDDYLRKIEKEFLSLKAFSQLTEQEQYIHVFKDMGILDEVETKEEFVFEDLRSNTKISNRDLGLGISQVLPVLIATNKNKNTTIAIEQPELHLHPAVQCELADEFIRSYKENKNEFLIETHSEHLLLRIMKRMRHTAEDREGRDKTLDLTHLSLCPSSKKPLGHGSSREPSSSSSNSSIQVDFPSVLT